MLPPVGSGVRVRITGDFRQDPKHGEQFRADTLVTLAPETLVGLERYLGSGLIPGIGPAFAKRIVSAFGMDSLTMLDHEPELALFAPDGGLAALFRLVEDGARLLRPGGLLALELGEGQGDTVRARILERPAYEDARVLLDLAGRTRMALARRTVQGWTP
jgi:exodeoxyribonuclease V alpha subunit